MADDRWRRHRRLLPTLAAAAFAVAVLAGCGADSAIDPSSASGADQRPSPAAATDAASTGDPSGSTSADSGAACEAMAPDLQALDEFLGDKQPLTPDRADQLEELSQSLTDDAASGTAELQSAVAAVNEQLDMFRTSALAEDNEKALETILSVSLTFGPAVADLCDLGAQ